MELKKGDLLIDVSHNNGKVDWSKVKGDPQNIRGALIKSSEGSTGVDSRLRENTSGAVARGLKHGFYHFATWNNSDVVTDAKQEAAHLLATVGPLEEVSGKPTLPLVLDAETNKPLSLSKQQVLTYIKTFIGEIVNAGYTPAIYSSPGFMESYLPPNHGLNIYLLWIAHYTTKPKPRTTGWPSAWLWQFTDNGKVQGISGNVDMNRVL